MKPIIIVGLQWGDEGKGKVVDYLASKADYVVRFNGGNNAGHTVVHEGQIFKFHHLPSGAIQGRKLLIAQGAVINPKILLQEISQLNQQKIKVNLAIDPRVHIVMPYHQLLDIASEKWKGENATGSLKLGIGFCYEDKNNRLGIRIEDLLERRFLQMKLETIFPLKKAIIEKVYGQKVTLTVKEFLSEYINYGKKLAPYISDVTEIVYNNMHKKCILLEAAHGTFLDPAFGTYPYTVAPYCIAGAAFTGIGIGPAELEVVGVVKAYTTRVGNGPFPTEQNNKTGQILQQMGGEIGTTSGRVRRCGWLDIPMIHKAIRLNGCTFLTLTKLDVLSGLKTVKVATSYLYQGKKIINFPSQTNIIPFLSPVYHSLPGWGTKLNNITRYQDLPLNCRVYVEYIEKQVGLSIKYISVGAERGAIIKH